MPCPEAAKPSALGLVFLIRRVWRAEIHVLDVLHLVATCTHHGTDDPCGPFKVMTHDHGKYVRVQGIFFVHCVFILPCCTPME